MTKNICVKCGGKIKENYKPLETDKPSARIICDKCYRSRGCKVRIAIKDVHDLAEYYMYLDTSLDRVKLQSCLYFTYAYYGALNKDSVLFEEDFFAVSHGSIIKSVSERIDKDSYVGKDKLTYLSEEDREFIINMFQEICDVGIFKLITRTAADEAWQEAYLSKKPVDKKRLVEEYISKYI